MNDEFEYGFYDILTDEVYADEDGHVASYIAYRAPEQLVRIKRLQEPNAMWVTT